MYKQVIVGIVTVALLTWIKVFSGEFDEVRGIHFDPLPEKGAFVGFSESTRIAVQK